MTKEELRNEIDEINQLLENPDPSISFVLINALKVIKERYEVKLKEYDER